METQKYKTLILALKNTREHARGMEISHQRSFVLTKIEEALLWATVLPDRYQEEEKGG